MKTMTTNRGNTYEIDFAYGPLLNGSFIAQIRDERRLGVIAPEFDGLESLTTHDDSTTAEPITYTGYSVLRAVERMTQGVVKIELMKEENGNA